MVASCQLSFYAGAAMIVSLFLWRICRRQKTFVVPLRDISKGHHWYMIDILSHTAYCSVCESLVVDGWYCDSCNICSDNSCVKIADKTIYCKSLCGTGSNMRHHWIRGNLPNESICDVCEKPSGLKNSLSDFRCCWCQRTVHTNCQPMIAEICDFGRFREFIIPPYCIKLKMLGWKGRRHHVVGEVKAPAYDPWTPLVVIANRKSGNNEGDLILRAFRGILNPAQVIDLADLPPESGLNWAQLIPHHRCKVLVAGGDGTVGWVLSAIDKLKLQPHPEVAILPLGTGNDLARVMEWGEGLSCQDFDAIEVMDQILSATTTQLDRWKIHVSHYRHLGIRKPSKDVFMVNYASVGVDALVALNFHQTRQSKFYIFSSRIFNKFLYMGYGTKNFLERQCKNLHDKMTIFIDDQRIVLPEVEAIVVLNIPSWGAGVRPWTMGAAGKNIPIQSCDDGLLEVIGLYSTFHIAQLQIGLSEPLRLGQGRHVKIHLKERLPIQVDGEPWEQSSCLMTFSYQGQATMLRNNVSD